MTEVPQHFVDIRGPRIYIGKRAASVTPGTKVDIYYSKRGVSKDAIILKIKPTKQKNNPAVHVLTNEGSRVWISGATAVFDKKTLSKSPLESVSM